MCLERYLRKSITKENTVCDAGPRAMLEECSSGIPAFSNGNYTAEKDAECKQTPTVTRGLGCIAAKGGSDDKEEEVFRSLGGTGFPGEIGTFPKRQTTSHWTDTARTISMLPRAPQNTQHESQSTRPRTPMSTPPRTAHKHLSHRCSLSMQCRRSRASRLGGIS